jgi:hypothetical protein
VSGTDFAGIVSRLEAINEELAELALDRLTVSVTESDADAAAEERVITKARRAVEKAAGILAGMPD